MRKLMAACAALAALAAAPAGEAQSRAPIAGTWSGFYGYAGREETVEFQARLSGAGAFTGATVEPATFGDGSVLFLTANIRGNVAGDGGVHFTKTYDGSGGQTHSVQYDGKYDANGKCIVGEWSQGGGRGPFEMCTDAHLLF
ncbi:MAG: hypothetical protein AB7M12_08120 [Hyphomonadaceae bacterium]